MMLDPAGREYVEWPITVDPADPELVFEISVDDGTTWQAMTRDGDTLRVLVAGPEATDNPAGTVALTASARATIRCVDTPEIIIRNAGMLHLG